MSEKFSVVLPAGGLGRRMGGNIPKQLLEIEGKPVYRYSLETFLRMKEIEGVALVVPSDWKSRFEDDLKFERMILDGFSEEEIAKLKIVEGGSERWLSVKNGVEALSGCAEYVLVHDVARPFISENLVRKIFQTLLEKGACIVAKPSADTVKIGKCGKVEKTLDRSNVWLAQTPQAARIDLFKTLYQKMESSPLDFIPTDEASILEYFGEAVYIVEGNSENDKMTTPEDFEKAKAFLQSKK